MKLLAEFVLVGLAVSSVGVEPMTADAYLQAIGSTSAKEVASIACTSSVLADGVETAAAKWLQVASILRPHLDAGCASEVEVAPMAALFKAPDRVVLLLSTYAGPPGTFEITSISGNTMIERPAEHYAKLLKALKAVGKPSAPEAMRRCIQEAQAAAFVPLVPGAR